MAAPPTGLIPFDFEYYVRTLIEYLRQTMPADYQDFLESNASRALIDAIGFESSLVAYSINANLKQMFLPTATTRRAMYLLGKLVNYNLHGPTPSTVELTFYIDSLHPYLITIPPGTSVAAPGVNAILFETIEPGTIPVGRRDVEVVMPDGSIKLTVKAVQGSTVTEIIGTSSGAPNQSFKSSRPPLLETLTVTIDGMTWPKVNSIYDLGPNEAGFVTGPDESSFAVVTFGNGLFGQIPAMGDQITTTYRVGGGDYTNVSTGTVTEIMSSIVDSQGTTVNVHVFNNNPASGGLGEESIDEARINIPVSVRSMDRFVSREDFQSIPRTFNSEYGTIYKSTAQTTYTWAEHIITIYVLGNPSSDEATDVPTLASPELLADLQEYVSTRTLPTVIISCQNARLRKIDFEADVFIHPTFRVEQVADLLNEVTRNRVFSFATREIGDGLRLSDVYAVLDTVPGVDYLNIQAPSGNVIALPTEFLTPGNLKWNISKVSQRSIYSQTPNQVGSTRSLVGR